MTLWCKCWFQPCCDSCGWLCSNESFRLMDDISATCCNLFYFIN